MSEVGNRDQLKRIGETLHRRLVDGDITATAEIAEVFMPVITARLKRGYSNLDDPHLVDTAVEDALLNYFGRPRQYDPARCPLDGYLYMSARGDLLNLMKQTEKDSWQLRLAEIVELGNSDAEYGVVIQDEFELETFVLNRNSPLWQRLSDLLPDPIDQELILLMMDGIRETSAYAGVLGISDHSTEEQAVIVKRHKDRVKKRLQRSLEPSEVRDDG